MLKLNCAELNMEQTEPEWSELVGYILTNSDKRFKLVYDDLGAKIVTSAGVYWRTEL